MKLAIYGLHVGCSWCTKAVDLCREHGIDYEFFDIDEHDIRQQVRVLNNGEIPYIKVGKRVIGGYDQLLAEVRTGAYKYSDNHRTSIY